MTLSALSVVIPFHNEEGAAAALLAETLAALAGLEVEILAVDDGSTDATGRILLAAGAADARIRVIRHPVRCGQSTAIRSGLRAARHAWVATLDGDGQNPPDQIPRLLAALPPGGGGSVGLVQGQRARRRDGWSRRAGSRVANAVRAALLRDGVRDSGCGLKLVRRAAWLEMPFFDHIHRFTPAMMQREGWEVRVAEVTHRSRRSGRSKYSNLGRALAGAADLLGAAWLIRRRSPLAAPPAAPLVPAEDVSPAGPQVA